MIKIDRKDTGRMPALAILGSLGFRDEDQLRDIGGCLRSKHRRKFLPNEDLRFTARSHFELPLPLAKRLFEGDGSRSGEPMTSGNGSVNRPQFMGNWEDHVEPEWLDDSDTPEMNSARMKLSQFYVTKDAVDLVEKFKQYEATLKAVKEGDENVINSILESHGVNDEWFARAPFPHQKAGVAFFLSCLDLEWGHILLFDEMRTGKTKQAIDISRYLLEKELIRSVLIIVPNSIKRVWHKELAEDAPLHGCFTNIIEGSKQQKKAEWNGRAFYYIVNYEGARADKEELYAWEKAHPNYMLISDEAHKLKNPDSQQSQVILNLKPKYSIFMTGTPVANRPEDCWSMTNFVCPALLGGSIEDFYRQFTTRGGYSGKEVIRYENLDEVRYRLARVSMRRRRQDVVVGGDQVVRAERKGEMEGAQATAYEQMRDLLFTEIMNDREEFTTVKCRSRLTQILRLQQISDGFGSNMAGSSVWFNESWKLKELDEFLEEYLDDIGKVVVWSRFIPPIDFLTRRYEYKYGATCIHGGITDTANRPERTNRMYMFQNDPSCKIMIAQILSGGVGMGFQPATFAIFWDKWWSPAMNKQAEDRVKGIKNPVPITVLSYVTQDSIDERIEFILSRKKGWADVITGDEDTDINIPDVDKNMLLYLTASAKDAEKYKELMMQNWDKKEEKNG